MPLPYEQSIFTAAANNDEETVKRLIEKDGVAVKTTNEEDATAGHIAAEHGHFNILKYLIAKDSSILTETDYSGKTIFYLVVENGYLDIVKYLVEVHAQDIGQHNNLRYGCTPIHFAAQYGRLDILKYFLEMKDGNVDTMNQFEQTPVFLAAINKHQNVVKYLIEEKGANATLVDHEEHNLLHAAVTSDDVILMKYLLDEKKLEFDLNCKDVHGRTLVHRAALLEHLDCLTYLVQEKHVDINAPDHANRTALHSAAHKNNFKICEFLVEHGADTEIQNDQGMLPVQETTSSEIVTLLENAASRRRDRRDVSTIFQQLHSHSVQKSIPIRQRICERASFQGWEWGNSHAATSFQFQNFLALASLFVGTTGRSSFQQSLNLGPSSSREVIRSRIIPLAVQSIDTFAPSKTKL